MAAHLRTSLVALGALVAAIPLLTWLAGEGLVQGPPVLLSLLLALVVLAADDRSQRELVGGRLVRRPLLRLLVVVALIAVLCWTAGWGLLVPAATALVAVPVVHRAGSRLWPVAVSLVSAVTVAGETALGLGLLTSVVDPVDSHVAAGLLLAIAWGTAAVAGRDAADREHAQVALARAEARLRALMESSTDVLTVTAPDGTLSYVSPAVEQALGHRPADLLGRPLLDLVDPEHRAAVTARLSDLVRQGAGARARADVLAVHASLERRWYEWSFHNLLDDPLVQGMVVQQRDVTERLQAQRALAHAASHDDLTGLPNRGELVRRMASSLPQAGPGAGVAVLFVDLDLFKDVNDRLGHQAGDDVLVVVARRLAASLRAHDHLGRLGGDEFGVLLTELRDEDEVHAVVGRLVHGMEQPITLPAGSAVIGASVGYAFTTDPSTPLDRLLAVADARMYEVKGARRGR